MSAQVRKELDPRVKLLLLAVISWLALYAPETYQLLLVTAVSLVIPWLTGVRTRELLLGLGPMATLIVVFSLLGPFLDPRLPWLFRVGPVHFSVPGLEAAAFLSWRVIIILWWAWWFTNTTSVRAMTMALEWLFSPLNKLGIRTSGLILAIIVALRFIPELLAEGEAIKEAQQLRGYRERTDQTTVAARSLLVMLIPLLTRTWLRAEDLADAIVARGYRPEHSPVRLYPLTLSGWDIGVMAGIAVLTAWTLV